MLNYITSPDALNACRSCQRCPNIFFHHFLWST